MFTPSKLFKIKLHLYSCRTTGSQMVRKGIYIIAQPGMVHSDFARADATEHLSGDCRSLLL